MKKKTTFKADAKDELRPEYDFSGGVRNRYAKQMRENGYTIRVYHRNGTITEKRFPSEKTVTLEPDVQKYFPTSHVSSQKRGETGSSRGSMSTNDIGQRRNKSQF